MLRLYNLSERLIFRRLGGPYVLIKEFIKRINSKDEIRKEIYNPYKPLTREEIIEQLANAKKHANEGKTMDAHRASSNIREKYGL